MAKEGKENKEQPGAANAASPAVQDPKRKKVNAEELKKLQADNLLVGYDPATGIAVIK